MSLTDIDNSLRDGIREVVADILEVDIDDVAWTSDFQDEHGADSMQGIEILARLERRFGITIDQALLPEMTDLSKTYAIVAEALGKR